MKYFKIKAIVIGAFLLAPLSARAEDAPQADKSKEVKADTMVVNKEAKVVKRDKNCIMVNGKQDCGAKKQKKRAETVKGQLEDGAQPSEKAPTEKAPTKE